MGPAGSWVYGEYQSGGVPVWESCTATVSASAVCVRLNPLTSSARNDPAARTAVVAERGRARRKWGLTERG